mmetsp:Transcript_6597/g.21360  ORF Transcript_6597/g.21360 Transcript_6597/m.21360 type:complete len:342 (-) Transcript_6597:1055-2080(-)
MGFTMATGAPVRSVSCNEAGSTSSTDLAMMSVAVLSPGASTTPPPALMTLTRGGRRVESVHTITRHSVNSGLPPRRFTSSLFFRHADAMTSAVAPTVVLVDIRSVAWAVLPRCWRACSIVHSCSSGGTGLPRLMVLVAHDSRRNSAPTAIALNDFTDDISAPVTRCVTAPYSFDRTSMFRAAKPSRMPSSVISPDRPTCDSTTIGRCSRRLRDVRSCSSRRRAPYATVPTGLASTSLPAASSSILLVNPRSSDPTVARPSSPTASSCPYCEVMLVSSVQPGAPAATTVSCRLDRPYWDSCKPKDGPPPPSDIDAASPARLSSSSYPPAPNSSTSDGSCATS